MRIAYIVQCHKNPEQLNALFSQLLKHNCDIYVHIDKKSYAIHQSIINDPRITIIPFDESVSVTWGGITQVNATLVLIKYVMSSNKQYDFVWFISGQDIPIKSHKYIDNFLETNKNYAFIEVKQTSNKRYQRLLKRNEVLHTEWLSKKSLIVRIVRNAWYLLSGGRYHTFSLFKRKLDNDVFYFGSCWWCFPFDAILEIDSYLATHPRFINFFKHCHCPDESFFQTLIMNHSSYGKSIKDKLVYVDWNGCKNSPRTLTINDYNDIVNSHSYLLARKFDEEIDKEIIAKLLKEISN